MRMRKTMLCCLLALLCAVPALAAPDGWACYVKANTMPVYKEANVLSKCLGVMSYGENLQALDWKGDWVRVQNGRGNTGYCAMDALTLTNPNREDVYGRVRSRGAKVYNKPLTSSTLLEELGAGEILRAMAFTKDKIWARVEWKGGYGYVRCSQVQKISNSSTSDLQRVWIVSSDPVIVSSGKNTKGDVGYVSHGQDYTLLRTDGDWARLRNARGKEGWVPKRSISRENPNDQHISVYAQMSGRMLFKNTLLSPDGGDANVMDGTWFTLVATTPNGKWNRVKDVYGKYHYIPSNLLDTKQPDLGNEPWECTADECPAYKTAGTFKEEKIVHVAKKSEKAYPISTNGFRIQLSFADGTVGWCDVDCWEKA